MSMAFSSIREEHEFMNRVYEREHAPETHDCPRAYFCEEDPHCEFARCDGCGMPNDDCVCDNVYMRFHDK